MGSVCCVPAKSSRDDLPRQTNWRMNSNFSPPFPGPTRWEDKADDAANGMHLYRSSFSSSSRGSRRGSSRILGPRGGISQEPSPSSSFRAAHLNSSQICPLVDVVPLTTSDSSSSPCMTISPSKEGFLSTALSTPESFYSNPGSLECFQPPTQVLPPKQINPSVKAQNPVTGHHFSKSVPEKQFAGIGSRSPFSSDERLSVKRSGSGDMGPVVGGPSDWWSMQTFSELVASSRRERLRWMSPSSPEEFFEGLDPSDFLALEKIKACSTQAGYVSPSTEPFICGLCSRWLSRRSPLSSHKMIGNIDLPSVGVLSCGHVFHADCLDQATSDVEKQDPPCPQCATKTCISKGRDPKQALRIEEGGMPVYDQEKNKPTSKRTFSFKSKPVDSRTKKSISFSQVSPDNQMEFSSPAISLASRRGSSFRYLRGW